MAFDVGLGLENTHVLITGGAGLVGGHVVRAFLAAGSKVTAVDLAPNTLFEDNDHHPNLHFLNADIRDPARMEAAFRRAWSKFGPVHTCVALASLDLSVLNQTDSLADMDPREWNNVIDTNVNGTFVTCRQWLRSLRSAIADNPDATSELRNVSLIIMGSESGRFGVRTMAAYATGKAAVQVGLLQSLALDVPRIFPRARVNAIAPGPVDTPRYREEMATYGREWHWKEAEATVPLARAVPPEDVARTILFLASERYSGSVHGQLIPIDGGKTGALAWTQQELDNRITA